MEILGFMTAVLGSVIFWSVYAVVSFFITILMAKSNKLGLLVNSDLLALTNPEDAKYRNDVGFAAFAFTCTCLLWPVILFIGSILCVTKLIGRLALNLLSFTVRLVAPKVPVVRVDFNKKD